MPITRNRSSLSIEPRAYDVAGLPTRYFHPGELQVLLHLYEMVSPRTVIEFGVNIGRNVVAALRNIPDLTHYVGIDVESTYESIMKVQRKEVPAIPGELALHDPRFTLIVRPNGSFDLTPADLPPADAVFIDADHSRAGVMNDYALALEVVRPGGVIIFHDDNCLPVVEVTQTLNDLVDGGADIVHVAGTWLAFQRIAEA
jgi:predicted O-methyltransferase YrrM